MCTIYSSSMKLAVNKPVNKKKKKKNGMIIIYAQDLLTVKAKLAVIRRQ